MMRTEDVRIYDENGNDITEEKSAVKKFINDKIEWIKNHKKLTMFIGGTALLIFGKHRSAHSIRTGFNSSCVYKDAHGKMYHLSRPLTEEEYYQFRYRIDVLGESPVTVFKILGVL